LKVLEDIEVGNGKTLRKENFWMKLKIIIGSLLSME
jgi:hypothetical protein